MNGSHLLDSNTIIALFANEANGAESVGKSSSLYTTSVVAGELYYGALNSSKKEENVSRLELFLDSVQILNCDAATSKLFGSIKASLRTQGKPIPDNDIWIAASAIQHSLTLVTRDDHFSAIETLGIKRW